MRPGECGICGAAPSGIWGRTECDDRIHRAMEPFSTTVTSPRMQVEWAALTEDLRMLRVEFGLTVLDLAALLGVSATAVIKWEHGLATPSVEHQDAIVALIGDLLDDDVEVSV